MKRNKMKQIASMGLALSLCAAFGLSGTALAYTTKDATIDYSKCDNCGLCATVCPKHLIKDSKVEDLGDPVVQSRNGPVIQA